MPGEFELIDLITRELPQGVQVVEGPGDDCAVLRLHDDLAVSTDVMVEGVHFRWDWSSAHDVGRKAVASSVADLEADGARPVALVVALVLPDGTAEARVAELRDGMREECERAGVSLVGGDLSRGPVATVTSTVLGDMDGRAPVTRAGARPGQLVAVRGRLGMAQAGLAVLTRGFRSPAAAVRAHRVPEPPYGQGVVAAIAGASAMIDVSDGLVADLSHIAAVSGVSIDIHTDALPVSDAQQAVAAALGGADPLSFVLGGGDDHALAATFAAADVPRDWLVIGRVAAGAGVTVDGKPWDGAGGWEHFGRD